MGSAPGQLSLWLVPSGVARRRLVAIIGRLAGRCGAPRFDPHVTLLGGIRVDDARAAARLGRLAMSIARRGPLDLTLCGVAGEGRYFRCLYLVVERDAGLAATRARAARLFSRPRPGAFSPHLSLVYGRLPVARRRALAAEIGHRLDGSLRVARVLLVRTGRAVRGWRVVAEVRLPAARRRAPSRRPGAGRPRALPAALTVVFGGRSVGGR